MIDTVEPKGCDTFVAYPPTTPDGITIFGKNSDRPKGEGQSITKYPAGVHKSGSVLQCTYISIPQASQTYAVLLSQIDWMWGCENGANECGVVIGNEAVWTKAPPENEDAKLLGMDLVRLGLERGSTSREALNVITSLLKEYGQGGACAENDPSFTYHNSFLIADYKEAWVLETAERHWVAKRFAKYGVNISNGLTIRTDFDLSSEGIRTYARENGLWDGSDDDPFDFSAIFSWDGIDESPFSRQHCGAKLLSKYFSKKNFGKDEMIAILQDHKSGICMHGEFETTASMVSELYHDPRKPKHWMTGQPYPCISEFSLQEF